jgi:hypothetical protein
MSSYTQVNGTWEAKYIQIGTLVVARWSITLGSSDTTGQYVVFDLPVEASSDVYTTQSPVGQVALHDSSGETYVGDLYMQNNFTEVVANAFNAASTYAYRRLADLDATGAPFVATTDDVLSAQVVYEAASPSVLQREVAHYHTALYGLDGTVIIQPQTNGNIDYFTSSGATGFYWNDSGGFWDFERNIVLGTSFNVNTVQVRTRSGPDSGDVWYLGEADGSDSFAIGQVDSSAATDKDRIKIIGTGTGITNDGDMILYDANEVETLKWDQSAGSWVFADVPLGVNPYIRTERITSDQTISHATDTQIVFNSLTHEVDPNNDISYNTSTGTITFNTAGLYHFHWNLFLGSAVTRLILSAQDDPGGSPTTLWQDEHYPRTGGSAVYAGAFALRMSASDTLGFFMFHNASGSSDVDVSAEVRSHLVVTRVG